MLSKYDLETPALVVDLDTLERNIERMAAKAREWGIALRPHVKTHKTPAIAHMQLRAGASGITVSKLGEAEVFAASGFDDLLVAYPVVGERKLERLLSLARRVHVTNTIDTMDGALALSKACEQRDMRMDVLVEIDTGYHRCGLPPGEPAADFVKSILRLPGLNFRGFMVMAGQIYKEPTADRQCEMAIREAGVALLTANLLSKEGIKVEVISAGSTISAAYLDQVAGVTEYRPGAYAFNDMLVVDTGVASMDQCALTILTTVVSNAVPGRAIIDAGSKALSHAVTHKSPGYGAVKGRENDTLEWLCEEHGCLRLSEQEETIPVGTKLEVIPNYCSDVTNLHDNLIGVRGEQVEVIWPILARGKIV